MGTKDKTQKRLEDFNDIFADIINALLFDGESVIKEHELETVTAKETYSVQRKIREIERDVAKIWKHNALHISCIGLENQTEADKTMPLRVICYDGAAYRAQLSAKEPVLYPVVTLVLYMGTDKHWDVPKNLKQCFEIDERIDKYVNDYKINVIELAWLKDEHIMKFKSEFRNFVELLRDTRLGRDPQYSSIKLEHVHELLQLMRVMSGNNNYEEFLNQNIKDDEHKGDEVTMNDVVSMSFKRKFDEGLAKGRAEGLAKGKFESIKAIMQSLNSSADKAMDALKTTPEERKYFKDLLAKGL